MQKLFAVAVILSGISALTTGIAGVALNAWYREWRGCALSAAVLVLGMLFIDTGRYVLFRRIEP